MIQTDQNGFHRFLGMIDMVIQTDDPRKLLNYPIKPEFLKLLNLDALKKIQTILDPYRNKPYIANIPQFKKIQDEIVYRYLMGIPHDLISLVTFLKEHFTNDPLTLLIEQNTIFPNNQNWLEQENVYLSLIRGIDITKSQFNFVIKEFLDPERAILSSLDIKKRISELGLGVAIGINTGLVYFGKLGTKTDQKQAAYGHDIDLAKRLQESAKTDQILIGEGTYRLTPNAFNFTQINDIDLKGIKRPIDVYEVLSSKVYSSKLRGIEGLKSQMIGRDRELFDLKDVRRRWLDGDGQIVSIIGEAGFGKSRLVSEIIKDLRLMIEDSANKDTQSLILNLKSSVILSGRCVSIGQSISYYPFIDILRTYYDLGENDNANIISDKVIKKTSELFSRNSEDALSLIGNLLSIRYGNELDEKLRAASPEQVKNRTMIMLCELFGMLAKKQPLMLILEDLHWADDLSLDLLSMLMELLKSDQLMLVCVYRPEQQHRIWQLKNMAQRKCSDRYTEINLKSLSNKESRQLIDSLLELLPETVKNSIVAKSEGNPFFIEESIRSLIDKGLVYHQGDQWQIEQNIIDFDIPNTIQSVVLSRVDRLQADTKYVLQCASVIGRIFKYRLLNHLIIGIDDLKGYINELVDHGLIYEERTTPELEYAFKHALEHEAVYQNILAKNRKQFHNQIANSIEQIYQDRIEEYYEELSHHYLMTDDIEKAIDYTFKAGKKAKWNYANDTAISYYNKVLEIINNGNLDKKDLIFESLYDLGDVYHGMGRNYEAENTLKQAINIGKEIGIEPQKLAGVYGKLGRVTWWQSKYDEIIEYAEKGLDIMGDDNRSAESITLKYNLAIGKTRKGDKEAYPRCIEEIKLYVRDITYIRDLSWIYYNIGEYLAFTHRDIEGALEWGKALEDRSREIDDLSGVSNSYLLQETYYDMKGDYKNRDSLLEKGLEIAKGVGDDKQASFFYGRLSGIYWLSGDIDKSMVYTKAHLELSERIGNQRDVVWANRNVGFIKIIQHNWDEAIQYYEKAIKIAESLKHELDVAVCHNGIGRAYLKKGEYNQAIESYKKSVEIVANSIEEFYTKRYRISLFQQILDGLETTYREIGNIGEFREFCDHVKNNIKDLSFQQWYLEPAELPDKYSHLIFSDDFSIKIDPSWTKINEYGDCEFKIDENGGLEIYSANRRNIHWLDQSAPRIIREISGDFQAEVCISEITNEKPQIGGLLIWKDEKNFLVFNTSKMGFHSFLFHGWIDKIYDIGGRGILDNANGYAYIKLERSGDEFSAYCSVDAKNWFNCGKIKFPLGDPIQIGIYAIGYIDRSYFCGEYKEGSATAFRDFKIRRHDDSIY